METQTEQGTTQQTQTAQAQVAVAGAQQASDKDKAAAGAAGTTTTQADGKTTTQADGTATQSATAQATAEVEIKLPEGVQGDAELLGDFKKLAKESGLTSKQAQALVDFNLAAFKRQSERAAAQWEQTKKGWEAELRADKDFGGAAYEKNLDFAQKAARVGGDAVVKFLADTGMGSHPVMVKYLSAIGRAIADDTIDIGKAAGHEDDSREAQLRRMFPNSPEMFERAAS